MKPAFSAWEELWFNQGDDDETRSLKSARDWDTFVRLIPPIRINPEADDWDAVIRRAKLKLKVRRAS